MRYTIFILTILSLSQMTGCDEKTNQKPTDTGYIEQFGWVSVTSEPEGATIYFNEVYAARGVTPRVVPYMGAGDYILILKLDGYQTFHQPVHVNLNETTYVSATLTLNNQ